MAMRPAARYAVAVLVVALALILQATQSIRLEHDANYLSAYSKKPKSDFSCPSGLFIQERASKELPGPGQHFAFGALKPWEEILQYLEDRNTKLVILVRHGQAISNWLSDTLGPDKWFSVETQCSYTDDGGKDWEVFDADLTTSGEQQAMELNKMLVNSSWFSKITGGLPARAVISPLRRCLHTATVVLHGLPFTEINVEEDIRETLGEDTCDARHSVSDPATKFSKDSKTPCPFEHGLTTMWPQYKFRFWNESLFGMRSDIDTWWGPDREQQKHQIKRATDFLNKVFHESVSEKVLFVVTHSGTVRSVLLAAGREPYHPENAELVPMIVRYNGGYAPQ